MDLVSSARGSENPWAVHGLRLGDGEPLPLRGDICSGSGSGVGTAVVVAVVSPVADGVELLADPLRASPAPVVVFKSAVTSIVTRLSWQISLNWSHPF